MSRKTERTWAMVIQVIAQDPKNSEVIQIEVRDTSEGDARLEAIHVAQAQYPNAHGYRMLFVTELDDEGKPVREGLNKFWPTSIIADGEVAELRTRDEATDHTPALPPPPEPQASVSESTSTKRPSMMSLISEAERLLMAKEGTELEYDFYNRPKRAAKGEA